MGNALTAVITQFSRFFGMIKLNDVIDILIVAIAFYYIGKYMIETKAWQSLKVVLALIILTPVSALLQLNTVNFILRNLIQVGAIAVIIVFQPELRSFLDRLAAARRFAKC